MRNLNYIDIFATNDVRRLKERLISWAEANPNGVLLFDMKNIQKIHRRMTQQCVVGYQFGNGLCIEDIRFSWHRLPGDKCILRSIIRKTSKATEKELYRDLASWEECTLWYEFRLE